VFRRHNPAALAGTLLFTAAAIVTPECTHHSIATKIHCRSALAREDVGRRDRDSADSPQG
jgi:hypothetical protein